MSSLFSIILAAGQGTRMKSSKLKMLHQLGGKPMIGHIVDTLEEIKTEDIIVVVGHKAEDVKNYLGTKVQYVEQKEQLGTGHAVLQVEPILKHRDGITLIINGDTPLLTKTTLEALINEHKTRDVALTILSTELANPTSYGRIIRDNNQEVIKIVEEKDASISERRIKEVNSGIYCFDNAKLFQALGKINNNNKQGEYYLTDVIEILRHLGERIVAFETFNSNELVGINDRIALAEAETILKKRILESHMRAGVTIIDPMNTYIEKEVRIGADTTIFPGTHIKGETVIGANCKIGPNADLTDVIIADDVTLTHSVIISSSIDSYTTVGPFAYIRPGTKIGSSVKIGDFVEVKNSTIGDGTKVPHLSYIGDADLGEGINIGCGTITVNYDGFKKHRTTVEDRAFIGCNSNLIAPVSIGKEAYIAAGSTITKNVPDFALSIARERQVNKDDYVKKIREKNTKS